MLVAGESSPGGRQEQRGTASWRGAVCRTTLPLGQMPALVPGGMVGLVGRPKLVTSSRRGCRVDAVRSGPAPPCALEAHDAAGTRRSAWLEPTSGKSSRGEQGAGALPEGGALAAPESEVGGHPGRSARGPRPLLRPLDARNPLIRPVFQGYQPPKLVRPARIELATWPSEGRMISTSPRSRGEPTF